MFDRSRKGDKALLIHAHATAQPAADVIEEFAELARSAGAGVVAELRARIHRPNAATLIGSGKVEELRDLVRAYGFVLSKRFLQFLLPEQFMALGSLRLDAGFVFVGFLLALFFQPFQTFG